MREFITSLSMLLLFVLQGGVRPTQEPSDAPPSEALREDAASYADRYRVSHDEAVRRLLVQSAVGELEDALSREERTSFAGMWIEHEPRFRVVLSFTDTAAPLRSFPELDTMKGEVEVRSARWTLADLAKHQATAMELSKQAGIGIDSDINVRENRVELYVVERQKSERLRSAVQSLSPSALVVGVGRLAERHQLDGGERLSTCTAGFPVGAPNNDVGISTAAHCGNLQVAQGRTLNFRREDQQGNQDVQWHSACGLLDVSDNFESGTGMRDVAGTRHRDSQTIGSMVCKFGMTTGRTCGEISSKSYKPSFVTDAASTFVRVEGGSVMQSNAGDSGGPWYIANLAYGINMGRPAGDNNDAIYMPINYISSIGVSVLTSDPPGPACNICSVTLCGSGRPACCAGACKPSGVGGLMTCQQ